jgi:hypothetical protein
VATLVKLLAIYIWKMIELQHHHNYCTTPLHMGVDPVCGAYPHMRECCAVVVVVLCKNQIPIYIYTCVCGKCCTCNYILLIFRTDWLTPGGPKLSGIYSGLNFVVLYKQVLLLALLMGLRKGYWC